MAETTNRGWPLPDGNSPPDVAYWMDALGQAIDDDFADSGWVNVSTLGGFAPQAGTAPQVRKEGNKVYFRWGWANTGLTVNSETQVGTIPAGYRPVRSAYFNAVGSTGNQYGMFVVNPAGAVSIRTAAALADYYLAPGELTGWMTD